MLEKKERKGNETVAGRTRLGGSSGSGGSFSGSRESKEEGAEVGGWVHHNSEERIPLREEVGRVGGGGNWGYRREVMQVKFLEGYPT